jgi:hypothetical protein
LGIDVEELPKYVDVEEKPENRKKGKMAIKVRQFAGQEPTLVWIDPEWTVAEVEQKLAQKWGKSPRATRLAVGGKPLPREAKFANLSPQIEDKVLDTIAVHPVGF